MPATKRIRITLELDTQFITLLNANCNLSGALSAHMNGDPYRQLSPTETLAALVLFEARGATPEQVHIITPMEWRDNIGLAHDERQVFQDGKLISKPAGTRKFLEDFLDWSTLPGNANNSELNRLRSDATTLLEPPL